MSKKIIVEITYSGINGDIDCAWVNRAMERFARHRHPDEIFKTKEIPLSDLCPPAMMDTKYPCGDTEFGKRE